MQHRNRKYLLLMILWWWQLVYIEGANIYCSEEFWCDPTESEERENFLCKYASCRREEMCEYTTWEILESNICFKRDILGMHNIIRNRVALGKAHYLPFTASNMAILSYDPELEFMAEAYLSLCNLSITNICTKSRSKFLTTISKVLIPVGYVYNPRSMEAVGKAFEIWSKDMDHIDWESVENNKEVVPSPWLNIIGARTRFVGCSRMVTKTNTSTFVAPEVMLFFVCVYGPHERFSDDKSVFRIGPPCSACQLSVYDKWKNVLYDDDTNITCSKKYPGLCEKLTMLNRSDFKRPFDIPNVKKTVVVVFNPADNDTEPDEPGRSLPITRVPYSLLGVLLTISVFVRFGFRNL